MSLYVQASFAQLHNSNCLYLAYPILVQSDSTARFCSISIFHAQTPYNNKFCFQRSISRHTPSCLEDVRQLTNCSTAFAKCQPTTSEHVPLLTDKKRWKKSVNKHDTWRIFLRRYCQPTISADFYPSCVTPLTMTHSRRWVGRRAWDLQCEQHMSDSIWSQQGGDASVADYTALHLCN